MKKILFASLLMAFSMSVIICSCGKEEEEENHYSNHSESTTRSVSKSFTKNGVMIIATARMVRENGKSSIFYEEKSIQTGETIETWKKENVSNTEAQLIGTWRIVSTNAKSKINDDTYSFTSTQKDYVEDTYFGKYMYEAEYKDGKLNDETIGEYTVIDKKFYLDGDLYHIEKLDDKNFEMTYEDDEDYQHWILVRQ